MEEVEGNGTVQRWHRTLGFSTLESTSSSSSVLLSLDDYAKRGDETQAACTASSLFPTSSAWKLVREIRHFRTLIRGTVRVHMISFFSLFSFPFFYLRH